jgi:hypothetical protein
MQRRMNEIKGLFAELLGTLIYAGLIFSVTAIIMRG